MGANSLYFNLYIWSSFCNFAIMRFKHITALFGIVVLFGFSTQNEKTTLSDYIPWSANYKLRWEDFQGSPDTVKFKGFKAVTWTQLKSKANLLEDRIEYEISCNFIRNESWHIHSSLDLLIHEQGHFDIAEVYARKLRKALSQHISKSITETNRFIDSTFKYYGKAKNELTDVYEKETDYSRNKKGQEKWNLKIKKMLEETKAYSNTKFVIKRLVKK